MGVDLPVEVNNELYAWATELRRPFYMLKPALSMDGNQWCYLHGTNLHDGVAGFGDSPELAAWDFDRAWCATIESEKQKAKEYDVQTVPVKLESQEDLDKIEKLAKHIADRVFKAGDHRGLKVDRMAFKSKTANGEEDLGGLCMSSMANVIRDALWESSDGSCIRTDR